MGLGADGVRTAVSRFKQKLRAEGEAESWERTEASKAPQAWALQGHSPGSLSSGHVRGSSPVGPRAGSQQPTGCLVRVGTGAPGGRLPLFVPWATAGWLSRALIDLLALPCLKCSVNTLVFKHHARLLYAPQPSSPCSAQRGIPAWNAGPTFVHPSPR